MSFVKTLPNDVTVKLSVEKVFKKEEDDSQFRLECRICDGAEVGNLINLYMYRNKKAGGPRKDTKELLEVTNPGKNAEDIPSYMMQGKIFETTPWHPVSSNYQMFGRFKYVGTNDVF